MRTTIYFKAVVVIVLCAILLPEGAWAANRTKKDNNVDLTNGTSWVEGTAPGQGDTAIWDGTVTTPEYCTNNISSPMSINGIKIVNPAADVMITNANLSITQTGIDMSQATRNLTFDCNVGRTYNVSSNMVPTGRILSFLRNYAVRPTASETWLGGGTIRMSGDDSAHFCDLASSAGPTGGSGEYTITNITVMSEIMLRVATYNGCTGKVFQVGGNVSLLPKTAQFGLHIGNSHNVIASYDLSAGALTVSTNVALGSHTTGSYTNMNSSLIVRDAGVAVITNDIWMGGVKCSNGVATVSLRMGGTLSVGSIMVNSLVKNYTSIVEFDGGTLKPMRDKTTFIGGLTQATLSTNGAVIDTANCSITISQKLENATGQAGKLTKSGAGRLTLSAANPYTGVTTINNGTLALASAGAISNSAVINVGSGATCDVSAVTGFVVTSGQSLMGLGVVTGATTVATGATLAPGGTNGTLLVTGSSSATNLVLGGTLSVTGDVSRVSTTPWLSVTGSVDLASSTITGANLNLLTKPQSYILLSYSGTRVGSFNSTPPASGWRVSYDDANKQVLLLGATPGLIIRVQ